MLRSFHMLYKCGSDLGRLTTCAPVYSLLSTTDIVVGPENKFVDQLFSTFSILMSSFQEWDKPASHAEDQAIVLSPSYFGSFID